MDIQDLKVYGSSSPKAAGFTMIIFGTITILTLLILIFIVLVQPPLPIHATNSDFAGGEGTPGSPYQVATAEQLDSVRNHLDAHFIQTTDIDLGDAPYNADAGWEPIGDEGNPFTGSYDGSGYTVFNLTIDRSDENYVGLFRYIDTGSELITLTLENVDITGNCIVGSLAGHSNGTITGSSAGGVVHGCVEVGELNQSIEAEIGGLVGRNEGDIVSGTTSCEVSVTVCGEASGPEGFFIIRNVGGLVGLNAGHIDSSSASGHVDSYGTMDDIELYFDNFGGLVGRNNEEGSVTDSDAAGDIQARRYVGGLIGYNRRGTIEKSFATGNVSGNNGIGGLIGLNGGGTVIDSRAEGNVFGLLQDIGGLIGRNYLDGVVERCHATGSVTGEGYEIGGLIGENKGPVTDSWAESDVIGDGDRVGGLIGDNGPGGIIANCWAEGDVDGKSNHVGGLIGSNGSGATITNCRAEGNVKGIERVGGLIGRNGARSDINNSYATGAVAGKGIYVGGLVGSQHSDSDIVNSYAIGAVAGDDYVGGLVGLNEGPIIHTYAVGLVSSEGDNVGGLIGKNEDTGEVIKSYYDLETTGQEDTGKGIPKTTAEMKAGVPSDKIYTGWLENYWAFPAGLYPKLIHFITVSRVTLTADPESPTIPGQEVTFTAVATGGIEPVEYAFYYQLPISNQWVPAGGYSDNNSLTSELVLEGVYRIAVRARSSGSTASYEAQDDITHLVAKEIIDTVASVTLIAHPASPTAPGEEIIFTAEAIGGVNPEYAFYYRRAGTTAWILARGYSFKNTFSASPAAVGDYQVAAVARSAGSKETYEAFDTLDHTIAIPRVETVILTADPAGSQQAGELITFTAEVTAGNTNAEFAFYYKTEDGKWTLGRDYNKNPEWKVSTTYTGEVQIGVLARAVGSDAFDEARDIIDYEITVP